ncbi:unnamed protein product [Schistocephalus solidus]|uniref:Calcium/calmodulin-dependent 3',5'-cyclic nucleotide phosphodiesterase 1C n=1 Tax=Schistocephalus solidus TaxID=70667 RepID=A0A183TTN4_SCHSO|nr:unnamed protein product [Schistocephalus solidus]
MGNEVSASENIDYQADPRRSSVTGDISDASSAGRVKRHPDHMRRQESLPSEADYTDSSDNSGFYHRQCRSFQSRNPPGGSQFGSQIARRVSEQKGPLLDVIKRLIVTRTSSSEEESGSQPRELSSTSLQDSACEVLDASQLSEEEKAQIRNVLDRVRTVESRETERLLYVSLFYLIFFVFIL